MTTTANFWSHFFDNDLPESGGPATETDGIDLLLVKLIEIHGEAGRADIAPQLQLAAQILANAHSIDNMLPAYRRPLAS
jgi:hypothetical protein